MDNNVFYDDWNFQQHGGLILPKRLMKGFWELRAYENMEAMLGGSKPFWGEDVPNGITDVGIHYLLEVGFRSDAGSPVAQEAPWYAGLIDNAGFTGLDAGDTMSSHTGWSESTDYTESVRQAFVFAAAAARAISDDVSMTMNATKTIEGIFVTTDNVKGGTTGTLWSTAQFSTAPALISGNVLTSNYSLSD
jgi:hypothetical protein